MKRSLNDTFVKNAKPHSTGKPKKYSDGGGLFLLVNKSGKYWRYSYRFLGKQKTIAFGSYPEIGLADVRRLHEESREHLAKGNDPSEVRKIEKKAAIAEINGTFKVIANQWLIEKEGSCSKSHEDSLHRILNNDIYPHIGDIPIAQVESMDVLKALNIMRQRVGATTLRAQQICGQVFRYAIQRGFCKYDPTYALKGAIKRPRKKSFAAITEPSKIGELLRAIDTYNGMYHIIKALQLAPLVIVRPTNIRMMEWCELDMLSATWTIPASKLKLSHEKKVDNLPVDAEQVPLSNQAVMIIEEMRQISGGGKYVFVSSRGKLKPIGDGTLIRALRRLGYDNTQMTAHGFRSLASSSLNELGFRSDIIEKSLFHKDKDDVRATYNRAIYLQERREMLQAWADYLDSLRTGVEVRPINRKQV